MEKVTWIGNLKRRHRVEVFALGPGSSVLACLHGPYGAVELPGGGIDENESPEEAAVRETAEEAGWLVTSPMVVDVYGNWIFSGKDDVWFNNGGWNEEENVAVVCFTVRFEPTNLYGSDNDALVFKLEPITTVIKETEAVLKTNVSSRQKLKANFRIAVLRQLLLDPKQNPFWTSWCGV